MKDEKEVTREFNQLVNMTASELEEWLKSKDSRSAGWPKDDGQDGGESVGHDSGRKIVEILRSNPDKTPEKYTADQIQHMRKVVSYCKRHLAQEGKGNNEKTVEEVEKTKSYASLKNWGHDVVKERRGNVADKAEGDSEEGEEGEQTGAKRKKSAQAGTTANKRRQTRQSKTSGKDSQGDADEKDDEELGNEPNSKHTSSNTSDDDDGDDNDDDDQAEINGTSSHSPKNGPSPGDKVSWKWGRGTAEGKVVDVKDEKTTITTKRGNKVSRHGDSEDPAVVLDTGKSKAVKATHELI
ncbi:hypothetical protein ACRE_008390 [Hapsidospora chrysogenum ATCC 11550]|uniref:Hypervirulence associated protein TUDOR domain-containing protein n=1 Tax=Hapsidospora chrysogenum (strain ATCC 11550 / CBS 779.69 / DSM 880 / IAM 14645 / JCM 23072 / IMI 49137) TaxID=857340 RepID=A0A086TG92_HAPC1|nr:hypothetical protein ACRE_008390 [Hapsidospora chrysogenum ATCC 11550]